jgi:molybdopterin converting factor small subunit
MTTPPTPPPADETGASSRPQVTVRYWAAARAAAGRREDLLTGGTVAAVLDAARAEHAGAPRFAQVLSVCSFLLGDRPLGGLDLAEVEVADGDVIEVLPPFAGG